MAERRFTLTLAEEQRIAQIEERLMQYYEHRNEPYTYDRDEIDAVRELRNHSAEDLRFLLRILERI